MCALVVSRSTEQFFKDLLSGQSSSLNHLNEFTSFAKELRILWIFTRHTSSQWTLEIVLFEIPRNLSIENEFTPGPVHSNIIIQVTL